MCVGAILNGRLARVHYGARDDKAGALGSVYDIGRDGRLNHRIEVYGGIHGVRMRRGAARFLPRPPLRRAVISGSGLFKF